MTGCTEGEAVKAMCGKWWSGWMTPELSEQDEIEIHLHNPHSYGNPEAYNEFLDSFYFGGDTPLQNCLDKIYVQYRMVGLTVIIISIAVLGTAVGYAFLKLPGSGLVFRLGIMSLLMGAYIYFDTKDIFFKGSLVVFVTYVRQLCIMFSALMLVSSVTELLVGKNKIIAEICVYALVFADAVLIFLLLSSIFYAILYIQTVQWIFNSSLSSYGGFTP